MKGAFLYLIFILFLCSTSVDTFNAAVDESNSENQFQSTSNNEAFNTMMQVLMSPRCLNCHPSGDRPTQGDDLHTHYYDIQRGKENHGAGTMQCQTCHQDKNNDYTGVPGAPDWHLAPRTMGWQGLNQYEIAEIILNPDTNGGLGLDSLQQHLLHDPLVMWAFNPGVDQSGKMRSVPPVGLQEYQRAVKEWISSGAQIPNNE